MIKTKEKKITYDKRSIYIESKLNAMIDEVAHIKKKNLKETINDILRKGIEQEIVNNIALQFKMNVDEVDDQEQEFLAQALEEIKGKPNKTTLSYRYNEEKKEWEETQVKF